MAERNWVSYSPPWAPHVAGRYEARSQGPDGRPEPQRVEVRCGACGATWQTTCETGMVRGHVDRFARLHTDSFGPRGVAHG